ncbi:MAG: bile acid:sodium symporter [Patescibacteria group bacterium]
MRYITKFLESYIAVLFVSLLVGIGLYKYTIYIAPYSTIFLGIIFFFSALKINLKEAFLYFSDFKMVIVSNIFMLIALPAITYVIMQFIYPPLAVAFLILAAMPSGMTSPFLSEIVGGTESLALVLTISTSFFAPITVPLMIQLFAGTEVSVGFMTMFLSLAKVIFIPFILANIVKYFWNNGVQKLNTKTKPISMICLGLLIIGIVSKQAKVILSSIQGGDSLIYLVALFLLFVAFHFLGYFTVFWKDKKERVTITVCLTYLNFTLAVYLVDQFFHAPNILIPVILSVLPWSILIIPFKYFARKIV